MTIQQLRYIVYAAETGSITEAAKRCFIAQSSLSATIKEIEKETGITLFIRSRTGITVTQAGAEFLGYARRVLDQMESLEDRYIAELPEKIRFGVSAQHYTFTENAFVELAAGFGQERYEFFYNATTTHQVMEDVKNQISDLGILFLSPENEGVLRRKLSDYHLAFYPLFEAKPHVFLQKHHPLATCATLSIHDLKDYPRINFVQGSYESVYYAEELFSTVKSEKQIRVNDRGAVVNFMIGLNAYTISSGIFPSYLHGVNIVSVPLTENVSMEIGYIICEGRSPGQLGERYIEALKKYNPSNTGRV